MFVLHVLIHDKANFDFLYTKANRGNKSNQEIFYFFYPFQALESVIDRNKRQEIMYSQIEDK